jgi:hypothetical protein
MNAAMYECPRKAEVAGALPGRHRRGPTRLNTPDRIAEATKVIVERAATYMR